MNNNLKYSGGFVGEMDYARCQRLLKLADFTRINGKLIHELEWPNEYEQQRAAFDADLNPQGQATIVPLSRQLADHSQLIRAGVPVITQNEFRDAVVPTLNKKKEGSWGKSTSVDVGDEALTAGFMKPKRVSCFIVLSDQLAIQNELLAGRFVEQQILSSLGRAIDKAALTGAGGEEVPEGLFVDTDILTHERATAGVDTLADLAAMEKAITDADGDGFDDSHFWICDTTTKETLRTTEGIGSPIWSGNGPLGRQGIASVHAPANSLVLASKESMAFLDFNKVKVESLTNITQATQGFRTLFCSAWLDFAVLDPNAICKAVNPS